MNQYGYKTGLPENTCISLPSLSSNLKNNDIYVITGDILFLHLGPMGQIRDTRLLKKIAIVAKQLRESKGLSQEEVYNETNIHIGRIETSQVNITVGTLSAICQFYKISLSEFHKKVENI